MLSAFKLILDDLNRDGRYFNGVVANGVVPITSITKKIVLENRNNYLTKTKGKKK